MMTTVVAVRARFLAPLVKTRGFGMTHLGRGVLFRKSAEKSVIGFRGLVAFDEVSVGNFEQCWIRVGAREFADANDLGTFPWILARMDRLT